MLNEIYKINVRLILLTGLYIGGTDSVFDIGGADANVIKNPLDNIPYIPGSSIKGKLKYLLKIHEGKLNDEGNDYKFDDENITSLYGKAETKENQSTRAIFRDLTLTNKEYLESKLGKGRYTEIKGENKIDPLKSTANLRFIERVPAGAIFEGEIVINIFDEDNKDTMIHAIEKALGLLEMNYLGGNGSRGYGRVKAEWKTEKVDI